MDYKNIVPVTFQLTLHVFGSLYFGPLATSSLSLAFFMALISQVITWPYGSQQITWIPYTGKFVDQRDIQKHSNLKRLVQR